MLLLKKVQRGRAGKLDTDKSALRVCCKGSSWTRPVSNVTFISCAHVCVCMYVRAHRFAAIDVLRLLTRRGRGNESPSAFAPALQLTPLHTSLPNDISLPNWLVRRSYTVSYLSSVTCARQTRAGEPSCRAEVSGTNCVARPA